MAVPGTSGTVESAPSIVAYNFEDLNWAGVAFQGPIASLDNYMNANGSSAWPSQIVGPSPFPILTASSPVSVTANNGSENIAAFGADGQLYFYWADSDLNWHQEEVAPIGAN